MHLIVSAVATKTVVAQNRTNTELLAVNTAELVAHIVFGSYIRKFIQIYQHSACKLMPGVYLALI